MGVQLSADEFKLFGDRVDINRHERITFGDFARVFKGEAFVKLLLLYPGVRF